ncbi:hypothetical protein FXW78_43190 [Rhodococcus opacus]|nr:hypothetical protein [Rhodococcus opacus]
MSLVKRRRSWSDLTTCQRGAVVAPAGVELSLAVAAWADLASRDPRELHGSTRKWAAIISVNFVGQIVYSTRARRASDGTLSG